MSDTRLQLLLAAAGEALRELQRYRDELVEAHVPMTQHPKPENIPEREVRADVKRQDRILAQLRRAITLYQPDPTSPASTAGPPAASTTETARRPRPPR